MEQAAVIYDWFGYALPLRERYRLIRAAGFDGVMLWWSNDFGMTAVAENQAFKFIVYNHFQ